MYAFTSENKLQNISLIHIQNLLAASEETGMSVVFQDGLKLYEVDVSFDLENDSMNLTYVTEEKMVLGEDDEYTKEYVKEETHISLNDAQYICSCIRLE